MRGHFRYTGRVFMEPANRAVPIEPDSSCNYNSFCSRPGLPSDAAHLTTARFFSMGLCAMSSSTQINFLLLLSLPKQME